jgi:hypothetical protein
MAERIGSDARTDFTTAYFVEQGLKLCKRQGVNPALSFMESAGVPRPVALRVLCSPEHFRKDSSIHALQMLDCLSCDNEFD